MTDNLLPDGFPWRMPQKQVHVCLGSEELGLLEKSALLFITYQKKKAITTFHQFAPTARVEESLLYKEVKALVLQSERKTPPEELAKFAEEILTMDENSIVGLSLLGRF